MKHLKKFFVNKNVGYETEIYELYKNHISSIGTDFKFSSCEPNKAYMDDDEDCMKYNEKRNTIINEIKEFLSRYNVKNYEKVLENRFFWLFLHEITVNYQIVQIRNDPKYGFDIFMYKQFIKNDILLSKDVQPNLIKNIKYFLKNDVCTLNNFESENDFKFDDEIKKIQHAKKVDIILREKKNKY